jgi:hypothetical protein
MNRGDFYRFCRMVHGYLSAFAFVSLMFFSVTGILLNHPDYFEARRAGETVRKLTLPADALKAAKAAKDPGAALGQAVAKATPLIGGYRSGEVEEDQAFLRFDGPKGASDVVVTLATGEVEATLRRAKLTTLLNELHRGRNAGTAWKWAIDVSAALFILLSVVGYVLFFSLRFRLVPSLILTAVSLLAMVGLVWWLVA